MEDLQSFKCFAIFEINRYHIQGVPKYERQIKWGNRMHKIYEKIAMELANYIFSQIQGV